MTCSKVISDAAEGDKREIKHHVYVKRQTQICTTRPSSPLPFFPISTHKPVVSRDSFLSIRIVLSCFYPLIFYLKNSQLELLTFAVCRIREALKRPTASGFSWPRTCGRVCSSRLNGRKGVQRWVTYGKDTKNCTASRLKAEVAFFIRLRCACWILNSNKWIFPVFRVIKVSTLTRRKTTWRH